MRIVRSVATAGLVALSALGAPAAAEATLAAPPAAAPPGPAAYDSTDTDRAALVAAHEDHLAAIAAGKLAQDRASDAMLRAHAARFVADHTRLDGQVRRAADELGVALPAEPTAAARQRLDSVAASSGLDFDRAWVTLQLTSARAGAAAARSTGDAAGSARIAALARSATPVLATHADLLRDLADDLGVQTAPRRVEAGSAGGPTPAHGPDVLALGLLAGGLTVAGAGAVALRRAR